MKYNILLLTQLYTFLYYILTYIDPNEIKPLSSIRYWEIHEWLTNS